MFRKLLRGSVLVVLGILLFAGISNAASVQITLKGQGLGTTVVTVNSITFSLDGVPQPPAFPVNLSVNDNQVDVAGLKNVPEYNDFCIEYTVTGKSPAATFCVDAAHYSSDGVYSFGGKAIQAGTASINVRDVSQVPSLTPYGLMLLVLILAGTAVWLMRRRSAVATI